MVVREKTRVRGLRHFFNHRGESTVNYVLCDKASLYNVSDFIIHDANSLSDHCIISFCLKSMVYSVDIDRGNIKN